MIRVGALEGSFVARRVQHFLSPLPCRVASNCAYTRYPRGTHIYAVAMQVNASSTVQLLVWLEN